MTMEGHWFKSSLFEIESGEDEEINPRIYGRQLAVWLRARLQERGYAVEEIINEDWGRCLMCSRDPFLLWVGCGNVWDADEPGEDDPLPAGDTLVWHCFATAEVPFWKSLFRKIDTGPALAKLHADLGELLRAERGIKLVEEP